MKGQAAMEYLTTYAWAIMALIVVMGGIAYFGFGSIDDYIPEGCTLEGPFTCDEWVAYQDSGLARPELAVVLSNPTKEIYTISEATFDYEGETGDQDCGRIRNLESGSLLPRGSTYLMEPGSQAEFTCNPDGGSLMDLPSGEKVKVTFEFTYKKGADGFEREGLGTIVVNIQD